jgi:hypothetical protein
LVAPHQPLWQFVYGVSPQSASVVQFCLHPVLLGVSRPVQVMQRWLAAQGCPQAFENVVQIPIWQMTPTIPLGAISDPSSVVGAPAAPAAHGQAR